jgi:hypothetical protein
MKIRTVIGAASAAFAIAITAPASAHDAGEKVTRNFEQAIPKHSGQITDRSGPRTIAPSSARMVCGLCIQKPVRKRGGPSTPNEASRFLLS